MTPNHAPEPTPTQRRSERATIALMAASQLVATLDFALILPLGPDLTQSLGIPTSSVAWLTTAYTAAAAAIGLLAARRLDRYDRRTALTIALAGLAACALLGAVANDLPTLLLTRAGAGLFGGPATALGQAIIADTVPDQRRGRAMGALLTANTLSALLGVPIGLTLAHHLGWHAPFLFTATAAAAAALAIRALLPPMRAHLNATPPPPTTTRSPRPLALAVTMTFCAIAASFLITPNLSSFVQFNLGLDRASLPFLYGLGGLSGLVAMRLAGVLVDRYGSFPVTAATTLGFVTLVALYLVAPDLGLPLWPGFAALMFCLAGRNVSARTLATRLPAAHERARLLSILSATHHLAASCGAFTSSLILDDAPDGALLHMPAVGAIAIALSLLVPLAVRALERAHVTPPTPSPQPP